MLYGAGALAIGTRAQATNFAFPAFVASFELTNDDKSIEAKALLGGVRRTVASVISEASTTLTLTYEYSNWDTYQMIFDEVAYDNDNIKVPMAYGDVLQDYTVVGDEPDEAILPMPDDSSGSAAVYITETDEFKNVPDFPAGLIGDYTIGSATGSNGNTYAKAIKLPLEYLGANATAQYDANLTGISTLGKTTSNYTRLGRLMFTGILANTEFEMGKLGIIVPSISLTKTPSFKVDGEKPSLVLEYKCNVVPGYRTPYIMYKRD